MNRNRNDTISLENATANNEIPNNSNLQIIVTSEDASTDSQATLFEIPPIEYSVFNDQGQSINTDLGWAKNTDNIDIYGTLNSQGIGQGSYHVNIPVKTVHKIKNDGTNLVDHPEFYDESTMLNPTLSAEDYQNLVNSENTFITGYLKTDDNTTISVNTYSSLDSNQATGYTPIYRNDNTWGGTTNAFRAVKEITNSSGLLERVVVNHTITDVDGTWEADADGNALEPKVAVIYETVEPINTTIQVNFTIV